MLWRTCWIMAWTCVAVRVASAGDETLRGEAEAALRKAAGFFTTRVATEGGYLWRYSEDLVRREGEGVASATTVWVQPPGTPSVGMALLDAHAATGDRFYLEAARRAGDCLVRGQVRSGGWDYCIDFDPADRRRRDYRVDPPRSGKKVRNVSVLDDNTTQSAVRFLARLDKALGFKDAKIHEAVQFALDRLLAAQYPNGAWPQGFTGPPDPDKHPVKKADYPPAWSRTPPRQPYHTFYTLNDNVIADTIEALFEAAQVYGEPRYRRAACKAGDFLLLAQMPDPQPAWAQQYDAEMHPAWARKFEPPAVTGGESQEVLRALMALYRETGERKYLEPIPRAVAYLRGSQLADGRLARFYELKTNRPLYFTRQYELTYDDGDLPTHYAFKVPNRLDRIEQEYRRLAAMEPTQLKAPPARSPARPSARMVQEVRTVIESLDAKGRWVEAGTLRYHGKDDPTRRVISCETFIRNVRLLSDYPAATRDAKIRAPSSPADSSSRRTLPALTGQERPPITGTFSIVAADPERGECGAAVASKYPAVGKVVPYVRAGVGAFCTQHWHHPPWGEKALDLLALGRPPEEVLAELLHGDPHREKRQLAIIDVQGRAANRNPSQADPSGIYWGAISGRYYACQGNTLAGREVLAAVARAYEESPGSLADRLVEALVAGDRAGGDHRGRLAAGIRVCKKDVTGYWIELYVDDHPDAVAELARRYAQRKQPPKPP